MGGRYVPLATRPVAVASRGWVASTRARSRSSARYGHRTVIGSPTTATLSAMSSRAQWFSPQPGRPSRCWPTTVARPVAVATRRLSRAQRVATVNGGTRWTTAGSGNSTCSAASPSARRTSARMASSSTATTGEPSASDGSMRGTSRSASSSGAEYRTASCSAPARSMAVLTSSRHSRHSGGLPPRSPFAPPTSGAAQRRTIVPSGADASGGAGVRPFVGRYWRVNARCAGGEPRRQRVPRVGMWISAPKG